MHSCLSLNLIWLGIHHCSHSPSSVHTFHLFPGVYWPLETTTFSTCNRGREQRKGCHLLAEKKATYYSHVFRRKVNTYITLHYFRRFFLLITALRIVQSAGVIFLHMKKKKKLTDYKEQSGLLILRSPFYLLTDMSSLKSISSKSRYSGASIIRQCSFSATDSSYLNIVT